MVTIIVSIARHHHHHLNTGHGLSKKAAWCHLVTIYGSKQLSVHGAANLTLINPFGSKMSYPPKKIFFWTLFIILKFFFRILNLLFFPNFINSRLGLKQFVILTAIICNPRHVTVNVAWLASDSRNHATSFANYDFIFCITTWLAACLLCPPLSIELFQLYLII